MGVHDNLDSKYNLVGTSNFHKFGVKRPACTNDTIGSTSSTKIMKSEKQSTPQTNVNNSHFADKINMSLQQQRKSLPVYKLRKK